MSHDVLRQAIVDSLRPLAVTREIVASLRPEGCAPVIEGVTHCESCGFSHRTPRHIVMHRDRCTTPHVHRELERIAP